MATLDLNTTHLHVHLSRFEKVFGLLPDLHIPLANVRGATDDNGILRDIGMRAPGLAWPRRALIGTFRKWKFKDFVVWRNQPHLVVIQLEGENWDRLVIGVKEPDTIVRAINSATAR
jgi:hypothetical protein